MYRSREHYLIMIGIALIDIRAEHKDQERVWALSNLFHNTAAPLQRPEWDETISSKVWDDLQIQARRGQAEAYLTSLDQYAAKKTNQ